MQCYKCNLGILSTKIWGVDVEDNPTLRVTCNSCTHEFPLISQKVWESFLAGEIKLLEIEEEKKDEQI
jgi:hypothetical protein